MNEKRNKSMVDLLEETREKTKYLRQLGVSVVEMWECEWKAQKKQLKEVKHFLDNKHRRRPTHVGNDGAGHRECHSQWYAIRHGRMRHRCAGTPSRLLCRNAAYFQERVRQSFWHRLVYAQLRWNAQHHDTTVNAIRNGTLFGMVECDIDVPEHLRDYFAEMQPIFKNAFVSRSDIGSFMRNYDETHNIMTQPRRTLVGSYHGEHILLATPLLVWYLEHGLVVSRVCQVIEYVPQTCFRIFGEAVSADGDADPNKSIIADTIKPLGNSAYDKTVTNKDMQRDIKYCTELVASRCINNGRFRQLDVVTDDVYEIEMAKKQIEYNLPMQIGFFVYQYAKLRMSQCYFSFVDTYVDRFLFQYFETDTDSACTALAGDCIDDVVAPETREYFFLPHIGMVSFRMLRRACEGVCYM